MTRLSVTVPAYQVAEYLPRCLDSLLSQTVRDIEIIVVNDGSTDSTGEICDGFARRDKRIRVIHQINLGLVAARKSAVSISTGRYIACVDGDDYVDPDYCESLLEAVETHGADVAIGGYVRDYGNARQRIIPMLAAGVYELGPSSSVLREFISSEPFFTHGVTTYLWGKIFRRDLYLKAQEAVPNEFSLGEDAACVYPLLAQSRRLVVTESASYHYVQRQSSMLKAKPSMPLAEISRMKKLVAFLRSQLKGRLSEADIDRQLKGYELSLLATRIGGVLEGEGGDVSIFGRKVMPGSRVAIYSAGTFGQIMHRRLRDVPEVNIVLWVDQDWQKYRTDGLDVSSETKLGEGNFDIVAIASLSAEAINEARKRIDQLGVTDDRVVFFDQPEAFRRQIDSSFFQAPC